MKKLFLFSILLLFSFSLRAQLTIDFTWCPVYDTSLQTCCIQFENLTVDTNSGDVLGYVWEFSAFDTSHLEDPMHCYPFTGTFTVYLHVTLNGVSVPGGAIHFLTINHLDTTDCNCDSLIGVNEISSGDFSFSLSPNPFREKTILTLYSLRNNQRKDAEIRIYNSPGALLRREKVVFNNRQEIIVEGKLLSEGIYYFEISSVDEAIIARGKFLIE